MADKQTTTVAEIWKPIPGYNGRYEVSNLGRMRLASGRALKTRPHRAGYPTIGLSRTMVKLCLVHRLVLEAFIGPCPAGMECCHNDGNPKNNRIENLRWDTRVANAGDSRMHGTVCEGESHWNSKLNDADVLAIRAAAKAGVKRRALADEYGVGKTTIDRVLNRQRWKHVPEARLDEIAKGEK